MSELLGDALSLKVWQQENAELQDEVARLRKAAEDWHDIAMRVERENRRLQKLATQRGARMQIMREWMHGQPASGLNPGTILDDFEDARPESAEWFYGNGVPIDA